METFLTEVWRALSCAHPEGDRERWNDYEDGVRCKLCGAQKGYLKGSTWERPQLLDAIAETLIEPGVGETVDAWQARIVAAAAVAMGKTHPANVRRGFRFDVVERGDRLDITCDDGAFSTRDKLVVIRIDRAHESRELLRLASVDGATGIEEAVLFDAFARTGNKGGA